MNSQAEPLPTLQRPLLIMICTGIVGVVMIVNGYRVKVETPADQIYSALYILGGELFLAINFLMEAIFSAAKYVVESMRAELGPILSEVHRGVKNIESLPATAAPVRMRVEKSSSPEGSAPSPHTAYFYSADGTQQGPLTAADLKSLRGDGLITDNTPVLRQGETQWNAYRDFPELKG